MTDCAACNEYQINQVSEYCDDHRYLDDEDMYEVSDTGAYYDQVSNWESTQCQA